MKQMKFSTTKWFQSSLKESPSLIIAIGLKRWVPLVTGKTINFRFDIASYRGFLIKEHWCK